MKIASHASIVKEKKEDQKEEEIPIEKMLTGEEMLQKIKHIPTRFIYKTTVWIVILGVFFVSGCRKKSVYHEYLTLENTVWDKNYTCNFDVEIEELDTLYDVTFYLRHTTNYPYSNIWLFVNQISPEGNIIADTIAYEVADYTGRWQAKDVGSVLTLPIAYKQKHKFKQKGNYRYSIRHGMRTDTLQGVQAIGFKLNYHGKK